MVLIISCQTLCDKKKNSFLVEDPLSSTQFTEQCTVYIDSRVVQYNILVFCFRANTAFGTFASRDFAKVLNTKVVVCALSVCSSSEHEASSFLQLLKIWIQ